MKLFTELQNLVRPYILAVSRQTFPAPHKIGDRAVAWLASDIDAWIDAQTAKVSA